MKSVDRRLTAVLFAVALGVSACGSDTPAASPLTEAEDTAVAAIATAPAIAIEVVADPLAGHNLLVEVSNFTISPQHASGEAVAGEGHFHLYADGERQMRFYNTALHLADLSPGEHIIEVELNNNDHSPYLADGEPVRASQTVTVSASEHEHGHGEDNEVVDVDPGAEAPTVELAVTKDAKAGWNLVATVTNFEFAPSAASTNRVDGFGHLHLYIDGVKITRLYGPAWHIPTLTEGSHTIAVVLSHNDHSAYGIDGTPIQGVAQVEVSAPEASEDAGHNDTDHGNDDHNDADHDDDGHAGSGSASAVDAADVEISVGYRNGEVTVDDDRVAVALGSTVALVIESDTDDAAHVHGYDHFVELTAGTPSSFIFTADVPGLFEVELESSGVFLFEIQVS